MKNLAFLGSSCVRIMDIIGNMVSKSPRESEFICSVCGAKEYRDISKEWENITFNGGNKVANEDMAVGLVWTCSEQCKVTYILQKET